MKIEKTFEIEREKDKYEYTVYADINNDKHEFIEITIIHYPIKQYNNHVKLIINIIHDDELSIRVRRVRNNWNGTGLDFTNMITIYTSQEFDYSNILSRERYEKINSVEDVKRLVVDIIVLIEDFIQCYIEDAIAEFIEGGE
jgi:hypothetical protein